MKNSDMPAMPFIEKPEYQWNYSGLTKREHFAAMAMQGIIASGNLTPAATHEKVSVAAINYADALLSELEK
jgi:hypothetical protein